MKTRRERILDEILRLFKGQTVEAHELLDFINSNFGEKTGIKNLKSLVHLLRGREIKRFKKKGRIYFIIE